QQTTTARYQWHGNGPWGAMTWKYDSGMVSGVGSLEDVLDLTAAQQVAIGFSCGSQPATLDNPITKCPTSSIQTKRLRLPPADEANDDTNPGRIAPRHIFDIGMGTDNLLASSDNRHVTLRFDILNITNRVALYNFLS